LDGPAKVEYHEQRNGRCTLTLKVIIEPGEDNGFIAHVPALRGCWSQGNTRDDVLKNIREAIEGWLETEQDKTESPKGPTDVELVSV
jgi:predicted RNase H-like HicB family nuclease